MVPRLVERGVRLTGEIVRSEQDNFVEIEDQDGNAIYLWEADSSPAVAKDLVLTDATTK